MEELLLASEEVGLGGTLRLWRVVGREVVTRRAEVLKSRRHEGREDGLYRDICEHED
jgi:hypothetical protein